MGYHYHGWMPGCNDAMCRRGRVQRVDTKSKRRASANRQERERDIIYSGELSPLDDALVRQTAHHRRPPGYDEPGSLYGLFTG